MPARKILRAILFLVALAGGQALAQAPVLSEAGAKQAASNYQRYCSLCHGKEREGHVNDHAPSLRSRSLLESDPGIIGEAIAYGRQGTAMGGYLDEVGGPLARRDIIDLTLWLADVAKVVPLADDHHGFDRVAGDAAKGALVYKQECVACHGAKGEGITGTALGNPAMLALTSDGFLRHAIVNGRQGTPMPAFGEKLSVADIDNVTAFLRSRSTGWTADVRELRKPPPLGQYVINPKGKAPDFGELKDGRYVSAAVLDRELKASRRMILLDTRVTSMWQMAHIDGAVPAPYYANREEVVASLPRDGTWIVAYCECPRAAADSVVKWLREEGKFANTAVLYEGIQGWVSLGYPVVAGDASKPKP
jgi:mono/diheme cytochrome c family protein/rhodanese-related sulfurtransferase